VIAARTFCPDAVLPVHIPKFMYPREAGGARARALKFEHSPLMGLTYNDGDKFLDQRRPDHRPFLDLLVQDGQKANLRNALELFWRRVSWPLAEEGKVC
jgi:hypothetical protein